MIHIYFQICRCFIVLHADQTNICLPLFITAIKTSASDQYSGNLRLGVTVGVILVLVMAVGVVGGVIYSRCRKHKQKRQKCKYYTWKSKRKIINFIMLISSCKVKIFVHNHVCRYVWCVFCSGFSLSNSSLEHLF